LEDLYPLPGLQAATERFHYALQLGAVSLITGDVGSGKSTALRYAAGKLHPSQYKGRLPRGHNRPYGRSAQADL